jgi:catechol 2,3-dioxygenase-like lactoylglutathione lyase family enzyme
MIMHPPGSVNLPCKEVKMKIAHVALWTRQLEQQARFWTGFFNGQIARLTKNIAAGPTPALSLIL